MEEGFLGLAGQRLALFVDGSDTELVSLALGQTLHVAHGVNAAAARDPKLGLHIVLLNLVVFNGAAAVIGGATPLESTA